MWCVCVCVCVYVCILISTPPLVFIAGSHGVRLQQPTSAISGEATCGEVEAVGPMGQVGRPIGRLTYQVGQPTPASSSRLSWAFLSDPRWSWPILACLNWVLASLLVHLSLNRCSDNFCDFMSGQSVGDTTFSLVTEEALGQNYAYLSQS